MQFKICNQCKIEKPLEEFFRNKREKDGRANLCKKCKSAYRKKVYAECKKRGICVKCCKNLAENGFTICKKCSEKQKQGRQKNKAKIKKSGKEYYQKHKEKINKNAKEKRSTFINNKDCSKCGKHKSLSNVLLCKICWFKRMSKETLGTNKH